MTPHSHKISGSLPEFEAEIVTQNTIWTKSVSDLDGLVSRICADIFTRIHMKPGAVTVVFSDDDTVQDLNATYRNQNKPTNVLSFATLDATETFVDAPDDTLNYGDVILAFETVQREADEQSKPFHDHAAHLVAHGLLHLLGYDHITEEEAVEMESLEREILDSLGIKDPYLDDVHVLHHEQSRET